MALSRASLAPLPKLALGAAAALAAINLSPGSAQAYVVTVNSVQYDVTTFTGSYDSDTDKFANLPAPGVMPWWGSESAATAFATALGSNLGAPNGGAPPFFAYNYNPAYSTYWGAMPTVFVAIYDDWEGVGAYPYYPAANVVWAKATLVSPPAAPAPGPLPLLGAGAAFGFSRKLRKRIKLAPVAMGSSLPRA